MTKEWTARSCEAASFHSLVIFAGAVPFLDSAKGVFWFVFVDLDKNEHKKYKYIQNLKNLILTIFSGSVPFPKYCQQGSFGPHSRHPGQK